MGFQQYPVSKTITIEGESVIVPLNTKFVTIDCCRNVQAWTSKPQPDEGWWEGDGFIMTVGEVSERGSFDCHEI